LLKINEGGTWDGRTMAREIPGYDWHEWSMYLDRLANQGIIKVIGINNSGMTQYQKMPRTELHPDVLTTNERNDREEAIRY
jgi:hypothetical protein